jgi:hypothetical protein
MNYEINGTYGSQMTPCIVFIYRKRNGLSWYCVEGSKNVNATYDDLEDGVDVECVSDVDTLTSMEEIMTSEELEAFVEF